MGKYKYFFNRRLFLKLQYLGTGVLHLDQLVKTKCFRISSSSFYFIKPLSPFVLCWSENNIHMLYSKVSNLLPTQREKFQKFHDNRIFMLYRNKCIMKQRFETVASCWVYRTSWHGLKSIRAFKCILTRLHLACFSRGPSQNQPNSVDNNVDFSPN